ncbi:hypothetical protein SKAU_G00123250 [Synaphobranchus kaupii]|uniref:Uncharacterized protein n=1 Tax=Synaphobranchus kaupii TaxID=118154 RepID=A0A9Q1FPC6_SYNKA|nr:hypothetical protein SKAU_G00123250 [Synaphobranchus kaupii]
MKVASQWSFSDARRDIPLTFSEGQPSARRSCQAAGYSPGVCQSLSSWHRPPPRPSGHDTRVAVMKRRSPPLEREPFGSIALCSHEARRLFTGGLGSSDLPSLLKSTHVTR